MKQKGQATVQFSKMIEKSNRLGKYCAIMLDILKNKLIYSSANMSNKMKRQPIGQTNAETIIEEVQ